MTHYFNSSGDSGQDQIQYTLSIELICHSEFRIIFQIVMKREKT